LRLRLLLFVLALTCVQPAIASVSILDQAARAIDEARFQDALRLIEKFGSATGPASDDDRDWGSYLKARALVGLGRGDAAEETVRARFKARPGAYAWASIVSILAAQGRFESAANEILKLDETAFSYVNRLRPRTVEEIVSALERKDAGELRDRLVVRLVAGKYSGPTSAQVPDGLRIRHVGLMLKQNQVENAARETEAIATPVLLTALLADRSYMALWDHPSISALLRSEALVARVERSVQLRLEQKVISSADWLETMRALRAIRRPKEAVRLGLHAVKEARAESRETGTSFRLELAYAYLEAGEAWAARRTARELMREGAHNDAATQLAVARLLITAGDDEAALALASAVKEQFNDEETAAVSSAIEACAAHHLSRASRRDEALAEVANRQSRALEAAFGAFMCTGKTDEAVAVLKTMLGARETRTQAILIAQLYADPGDVKGDLRDMHYRLRALAAREDVQAALKPHGRTVPLPFLSASAGIY
jgi:hypothetical protein